jgi:arylformamidase
MDKRVKFDFEIEFTNGGGIQGQDFRLDIEGDQISDKALADYIVQDLRLLMVGKVNIRNKEIFEERHKRKPFNLHTDERLIDLSHDIESGMITYKGLPAPLVCDFLSREDSRKFYEPGTEFQIGKIEMVSNTGTYIDCPFHWYEDGKDLSEVLLEKFVDLEGIVINAKDRIEITKEYFLDKELRNRAVLIFTNSSKNWRKDEYFENHPYLTEDAAEYLVGCNVKLVGIDSHNIDDTRGKRRPIHTILLKNEILIVEHLCNLDKLPVEGFSFTAAPPKFKGVGTFPVRAYAKLN